MSRARLRPQPWPWPGRPRVLLENPDRAAGLASAQALRWAGYTVGICPGPVEDSRCPLADDDGCALVSGADVIVSSLGLGTPQAREVLEALRTRSPRTPVLVEVAPGEATEHSDLLEGCRVFASPVESDQLVVAVEAALASEPDRSGAGTSA